MVVSFSYVAFYAIFSPPSGNAAQPFGQEFPSGSTCYGNSAICPSATAASPAFGDFPFNAVAQPPQYPLLP
jgi:hypothetical protein